MQKKLAGSTFLLTAFCAVAATQAQNNVTGDAFITQLTNEVKTFDVAADGFVLIRPHPMVEKLAEGSEQVIADKIAGKFTGNTVKDTYIRYHLMYVLTHPRGKPLPGEVFVKLAKELPETVGYEPRNAETYDKPELAQKYWALINRCRVTVGFPPFEKSISPPASFEHMDAAKRKECEALYAEALELRKQFKITRDTNEHKYNDRVSKTPFMLRQLRGECLYGMVASGEPAMLDAVIMQIARNVGSDKEDAADALEFFNAAYFDGWLSQYPAEKLKSASVILKRAVMVGDAPQLPKPNPGNKKPDPRQPAKPDQPRKNPLSERAFTAITAMENNNVLSRPIDGKLTRESPVVEPLRKRTITPANLDRKTIDDAIDRAVAALEKIRPPDVDLGPDSYLAVGIPSWLKQFTLPGNQAMANWAFLSTGEGKYDPWLQKRIGWVACYESSSTYDRAMRLRMLSQLPLQRWQPWFRRDASFLLSVMNDYGNFGPGIVDKPTPYGDNANGQYAVLALGAAHRAGYEIDLKTWKLIDQYWRNAQFPSNHADAGGWAVRSFKDIKPNESDKEFTAKVSAAMTAGGLLSLATTERILMGPNRLDTNGRMTPELDAGLKWLDTKFGVQAVDGDSDLYYYLWTIQNVGLATGYRTFNNIDWFREATAVLLNQQGPDGLWKGPKGPTVSTSFALLYLYRARGPLAFCKVRFGEPEITIKGRPPLTAWNNRPNDLANLADDITQVLEVPTNWQIADLDQPVYELIESATLYLTTHKPFTLTDAQVARLRDYINAGGMLIMAPEGGGTAQVVKSMQTLANQLYPTYELAKIQPDHPINTISRKLSGKTPVWMIDNGTRPLIAIIERDISRDLQSNQRDKSESFDLMTNLYLFAAGRDQKRPRIETGYIPVPTDAPKDSIAAARIKYNGNFDPEPDALNQLYAFTAKHHKLKIDTTITTPFDLKPQQKIAFLTLTENAKLNAEEGQTLRKWIDAGGTLWIDAAGGRNLALDAVEESVLKLGFTPADYKPITENAVATGKTRRPGGYDLSSPAMRPNDFGLKPSIRMIEVNNRPAVFVTRGDLAASLAGANTFNILGYTPETARKYVTNSLLDLPATK